MAVASAPTDGIEPVGNVRRSQLVSSFGIGAIVDLEKGSFMPMGLEYWERATRRPSLSIGEPRLQTMLGVSHFRLGPVKEEIPGTRLVRARSAAPAVRFPEWHECPRCHRIGKEGTPFELAADGGHLACLAHGSPVHTTPVRFVLACRRGHIVDFPWSWWAHRDRPSGTCDAPRLYLGSYGRSAALSDLYVRCRGCGTRDRPVRRSLGDAFRTAALAGFTCSGFRPWLLDREAGCDRPVRAIQRGASNVHFGVVCSALSIPPASEAVSLIVQEMRTVLDAVPEPSLLSVLEGLAQQYRTPAEQLLSAYRQLRTIETAGTGLTERQARIEEYTALSEAREDPVVAGVVPEFRNRVSPPPSSLARWFDLVGAASRLREVRALAGFSRIEPYPVAAERVNGAIRDGLISPLSRSPRGWLPAAEIRGEGIFFRLRTEAVDAWVDANPGLADRAEVLEAHSRRIAEERDFTRNYRITPRLLLVHSFSHAVIRQISVECGYSASALRERLYVCEADASGPPMNGVLVYTGSPDSEGSLGGLVRLAEPQLLESIVRRTLDSVDWCGSDPVCIETDPRLSGERIGGAACHCCLLLPETACEKFNRELDRTMLVGDAHGTFAGYFRDGTGGPGWPS